MERRNFIKRTVAASAAAGLGTVTFGKEDPAAMSNKTKFNLKYAPNFNAFPEISAPLSCGQKKEESQWFIMTAKAGRNGSRDC
jgi:hypothetical protein